MITHSSFDREHLKYVNAITSRNDHLMVGVSVEFIDMTVPLSV